MVHHFHLLISRKSPFCFPAQSIAAVTPQAVALSAKQRPTPVVKFINFGTFSAPLYRFRTLLSTNKFKCHGRGARPYSFSHITSFFSKPGIVLCISLCQKGPKNPNTNPPTAAPDCCDIFMPTLFSRVLSRNAHARDIQNAKDPYCPDLSLTFET